MALRSDPIAFGSTYEQTIAYPEEVWRERLNHPTHFVLFAERAGELAGTAAALIGIDGEPAVAQIVGVFVRREQRRQGIARMLLTEILARIAVRTEIRRVRLDVTETQVAAIALYRSLGFEVVGKHIGEMRSGDRVFDELIMERDNR